MPPNSNICSSQVSPHEAHPYQKGREPEPVMSEMKFTGKSPPFGLADGFASGAKFVLQIGSRHQSGEKLQSVSPWLVRLKTTRLLERRSHCEDRAEAGSTLRNTVVGPRGLCQGVGLDNGLNFTLRDKIQGFV